MGIVFILGPSQALDSGADLQPHLRVRREIASIVSEAGHEPILMEDVPADEEADDDLIEKFEHILDDRRPTAVLVYWPAGAKMQTTFDELLLLRKRWETRALPPIYLLHHQRVAEVTAGEFKILEAGGRSRYLEALRRVRMRAVPWTDLTQLDEKVRVLAAHEF